MGDNVRNQMDAIRRYAHLIEKQTGKAVRPYRMDGYVNLMNRYGTAKDPAEHYQFQREPDVPDDTLTTIYEGNGLFAKIIDTPAEEAIKHGFTLKDVSDKAVEDFVAESLDELDWEELAMTAIRWTRLFGGAIAVMLINDGGRLEDPLNWRNIKSIDDIRVYERAVVQPEYESMFNYDPTDPFSTRGSRLGMPEFYQVNSRYGNFRVHDSRCLVFQNGVLPENATNSLYQLWGIPEYIRIHRALKDAELAHESAPKLLDRSVQAIYKMRDLSQLLATEQGESQVLRRLQVIDMARGMLNSLVIDAEGEDYDFKTFQFNGITDVVSASCNMLSAITSIPQTILFGQGVGGMSSTDDTSMENYYNYVERIQKRMLRKNLRYLLSIIFQAGLYTGEVDEVPKLNVEFNPLWSLSDADQAALEQQKASTQLTKAQAAQAYVSMEAIDPSEVRKKLADSDEFDVETMLDELDEDDEDLFSDMPELEGEAGSQNPVEQNTAEKTADYAEGTSVGEHETDPGKNGSASPASAPAATKLPQDMSEEEKAAAAKASQNPAKRPGNSVQGDGDISSHPDDLKAGVGVLVVKDGKILSGTRTTSFGYGLICGPGGHIKAGETPIQAAFRETEEEFGISPKALLPLGRGPAEPDTGIQPNIFLCTDYEGEPNCVDREMAEPTFRTMEELEQLRPSLFQPFADDVALMKAIANGEVEPDGFAPFVEDGGPGSWNFNHGGRPGEVGGSTPGNGNREVAQGKDISSSYKGAKDIKSVLRAQGFDGLPKVVQKDEFDEAVKESNFVAQRTYTASSEEVLEAYRTMLYNGEWYVDCSVGGAQYGQGMYCAADYNGEITDGIKREMEHYKSVGSNRACQEAILNERSKLSKDFFDSNMYSKRTGVTEEEVEVFKKLKADPNMTGYKLPDEERKIWKEMVDNGHMRDMNLALSDKEKSFNESYKVPFFTETMTLAPDAKIVKFDDVRKMKETESDRRITMLGMMEQSDFNEEERAICIREHGDLWDVVDKQEVKKARELAKSIERDDTDKYDEIVKKTGKLYDEATEKAEAIRVMDDGAFAAMKGYDAINAENHGESASYTVILNRTKTIILDGRNHVDDDSDSIITFKPGKDGMIYAIRNGKVVGWVQTSEATGSGNSDGGPGSGNFGHEGGKGEAGDSVPALTDSASTLLHEEADSEEKPLDFSTPANTIKSKGTSEDGGPGSGNHGHQGVPGQVGGSLPATTAEALKEAIATGSISTKLSRTKQSKHKKGTAKYNRAVAKGYHVSYMTVDDDEIESIVKTKSGTGKPYGGGQHFKETVDAGKPVGVYLNERGEEKETTRVTIHYGSADCHVVPASPKKG